MTGGGTADSTKKPTVFISYARADRPRVTPLADALSAAGHEVWWDALIDSGASFAKLIAERLAAADAVIVAWSTASVGSDWVRDEADQGRRRGRLVPVSLDGTPPPLGFGQIHAVDLSRWRGDAGAPEMASVLRGLAEASGREALAPVVSHALLVSRRTAMIAGGGAAAVAAVGGVLVFKPFAARAMANSVAVLPFANLSDDPAQAYFSDGLAEEVRAALARNARLKVAAQTSSNVFRDMSADAKTVAGKLGVAFLLEGSVRKGGDTVRVAAELIDARTGFSSWTQTFDRPLDNILNVQSEIADTVANALAVEVDPASKPAGSTRNAAAYDAFLRGRALYNSDAGEASDRGALAQLDAALALDPDYAAALALHARVATTIANQYASGASLRSAYDAAIATARRAAALAPDLVDTQLALGNVLFSGRIDVQGAKPHFDRAARIGQGDADALIPCAFFFAMTGRRDEAKRTVERATTLDPLNARAWRMAGTVAYARRDYSGALTLWDKALSINPKLSIVQAMKGNALLLLGRSGEAKAACAGEPNESFRLTGLALATHKLGDDVAARKAQADLVARVGDGALYQQAELLSQWGQTDAALATLTRARTIGDSGLIYVFTDPFLDPLRQAPQFSDLLKSLGFA